jgi:RNA polymerase sigma-70 factor, ECF subfamily
MSAPSLPAPERDMTEPDQINWLDLVRAVQQNDPEGLETLYKVFSRGIRFYLCRQLGAQELDDKVHDTFLIVVQAIQRGELREPERLMGFVRTVVRRQVAAHIDRTVTNRREQTDLEASTGIPDLKSCPEESVLLRERSELLARVLQGLSQRDRDILTRFYLHEQTQEQICEDMNLSETQFRLLKSRAKARFGEIGKRKLLRRPLAAFFLRASARGSH